ncbi:MAG: prepilin peptidase [Erysipelotrichia bacterium]|nr:prepilin peptidase [Erysipelotrichia bacterium]
MEYMLVFFIGSCFGSFINVLSYRSIRKMNYITGRSHCPYCHKKLSFWDMIPIIGFIMLGGKCRYCKHKISKRYLLTEIIGGFNAVVVFQMYNQKEKLLYFVLLNLLLFISLQDIEIKEVKYTYQLLVFLIILLLDYYNHIFYWKTMLYTLLFFLLVMIITNGFGGADVILYALLALLLGKKIIIVYIISLIIGSIVSLYYLVIKKKNTKYKIAFIPCISLAFLMYLMFEEKIYVYFYLFTKVFP